MLFYCMYKHYNSISIMLFAICPLDIRWRDHPDGNIAWWDIVLCARGCHAVHFLSRLGMKWSLITFFISKLGKRQPFESLELLSQLKLGDPAACGQIDTHINLRARTKPRGGTLSRLSMLTSTSDRQPQITSLVVCMRNDRLTLNSLQIIIFCVSLDAHIYTITSYLSGCWCASAPWTKPYCGVSGDWLQCKLTPSTGARRQK